MFRLTLSRLAATRRRLVGTTLSIVLGVAFLSGTLLLGSTLEANFTRLFTEAVGSTDIVIRGDTDVSTEPMAGRAPVPASVIDTVRSVDGVAHAEAQWQGFAQLIGADGEAIGGGGPPTIGGNWITDPDLNPYQLAEGRAPAADDEIVVNRAALQTGGVRVGDRVTVRTPAPMTATVVGAATFGDADGMGPTTFVGFTESAARRLLTRTPDQVSAVLVRADGVEPEQLAARVETVLPGGIEAVTGEQLAAENVTQLGQEFLDFLRTLLLVFSSIALFVATVSIYNTFSIVTAQRTREAALLRAVGASKGQVLRAVLAESLLLGVLASAVGVVAGIGVTEALKQVFALAGAPLPTGGLEFSARDALLAFGAGVVVTLVAGILPALRASAVAPLAALRSTEAEPVSIRNRTVAGVVLAAVAAAVLAFGAMDAAPVVVAVGSAGVLIGLLVTAPAIVMAFSKVLRRPLDRLRGLTGALAAENAARNPRRTASTASALLVGVAVVTVITVAVSSMSASTRDELDRRVRADLIVSAGGFGGGLSPELTSTIAARPEVGTAMGIGSTTALVGSGGRQVSIVEPAAVDEVLDLGRVEGTVSGLGPRELAVSRDEATADGWTIGQVVPVTFADGAREEWRIGAVYDGMDLLGEVTISREAWAPHAGQDLDQLVLVTPAPGTTVPDAQAAVTQVTDGSGGPEVLDRATFVAQRTEFVDTLLTIVYAMLALAVVIALMGIGTTLSLAVHERSRELGLLRAVGQTRAQVRSMVRWESALIAAFGSIAGVALGIVLGWAMVRAMGTEASPTILSVPPVRVAAVAVVAAGAGVLAAVRPARVPPAWPAGLWTGRPSRRARSSRYDVGHADVRVPVPDLRGPLRAAAADGRVGCAGDVPRRPRRRGPPAVGVRSRQGRPASGRPLRRRLCLPRGLSGAAWRRPHRRRPRASGPRCCTPAAT
jgi:putative ABC transport system permease protein